MAFKRKQSGPADRTYRRLRADEALIEMLRAERISLASRKQPDIPAKTEPIGRRLVELLKLKSKPK
jgi:hypothetical protein